MKISEMELSRLMSMSPEEKWDFVCRDTVDEGESGEVALLLGSDPEEALMRADAAARLYHEGRVKYVIPSGGVTWQYEGEEISEADLMKRRLVERGVPSEVIFPDNEARTTVENMICGTLVLARNVKIRNVEKVILVTSQFHMQRSLALAKALLPRKVSVFSYPAFPEESKEEWLSKEGNRKRLDTAVRLLKGLVTNGVVADVEIRL